MVGRLPEDSKQKKKKFQVLEVPGKAKKATGRSKVRDKELYVMTGMGLRERSVLRHEIFQCRSRKFGQGEILGRD